MKRWPVLAALLVTALAAGRARAADPKWLGDDLPLPLSVKTPQDIGFKTAAERQYLIFNLMAGGKLAFERGDHAGAVEKWETLLRMPGLDPQIARAVEPFLEDARRKAGHPAPRPDTAAPAATEEATEPAPAEPAATPAAPRPTTTVSGTVSGGGPMGPGGAVVWLKRLDARSPRPSPAINQIVTQREKTFLPHVLAVPVGTSVQFRNDDRIYHNVFSIAKPNEFDGGIRATGATYVKTFSHPGVVQLLCNIHATMNAYVVVVDSPYYAKAQASGAFKIHGVPPGRYDVSAWHEAGSTITHRTISVGADGNRDVNLSVGGDKRPAPFVPDKYGHKRQPQLGY
ncbi:MAG TPA: carboxypeptidase regulatory-like domain-containing protein [Polyangia bacterium]|nr:carboxypeptidase regulatory-like domain-containing protein [Polyangia bacterium]